MVITPSPVNTNNALCSLSDLIGILKRASWKIALAALLGASAAAFLGLIEPLKYTLQGSFREKSSSRSGLGAAHSALSVMLLNSSGDGNDNGTISTLKSRKMMEQLVVAEGLQGTITPKNHHKSYLERIHQNLLVEYARWTNRRTPIIAYTPPALRFKSIHYAGEVPVGLSITFEDERHFNVTTPQGVFLGTGTLDTPFAAADYHFTLTHAHPTLPLTTQHFDLTLLPLGFTAQDFAKLFAITPDQDDKSLLMLKLRYPDRDCGVACVNTLMRLYQEYLQSEHQHLIAEQLNYLQRRQGEVNERLQLMMGTYAENLSKEFNLLGFIDTQRAMEFLCHHQHSIKSKQLTISIEIKRLQQAQIDGNFYFDTLTTNTDTSFLNQLLWQISDLKQQHDSIQVALSSSDVTVHEDQHLFFEQHITELSNLRKTQKAVGELIAMLEKDTMPTQLPETLAVPNYMVAAWHAKLTELADQNDSHPDAGLTEELQAVKGRYLTYLNNFLHHLHVHSTALEESLAHQQNTKPELQGINLNIAQELFLTYSKGTNELEELILQHTFVIEQLKQPHFEISSLSAILTDPVSQDVATAATEVALAIKDHVNRSQKEVDRFEEELRMQRDFLSMHLTQARELLKLRFNLFKSKLRTVQLATLALIQQQIGVAQNQLDDYIVQRIDNLQQEHALLIKQQDDLQAQMTLLPDKWVEEQLIYQQMDLNRQMGREITNLVESKNISSNLEIVQSAPLDLAIAPLHPDAPRTFMLFWLGAVTGALVMMAWVVGSALRRGLPASADNLRLAGLTVIPAGSMRHLAALLAPAGGAMRHQNVLIAHDKVPSYAAALATLLVKQGYTVALLTVGGEADQAPTDQTEWVPTIIRQAEGYNSLTYAALNAPDAIEHMHTSQFSAILAQLSTSYDWVLVSSSLTADDPALLALLDLFDRAIIHVDAQPLPLLHDLMQKAQQRSGTRPIIFVAP